MLGPVKLAYRTMRPTPPPRAANALYIAHGLLGNGGNWDACMRHLCRHPQLATRLAAAAAVDMRNHGGSPHVSCHTNAALAGDLERFVLDHPPASFLSATDDAAAAAPPPPSGPGRGVVVGHSMGGLALMGALLRRWNEEVLLPLDVGRAGAEAEAEVKRLFGDWRAESCVGCRESMRLVAPGPLRRALYHTPDDGPATAAGVIRAAVVVDITPTVVLGTEHNTDGSSVPQVLEAMSRVDLGAVHSYADAGAALRAAGVQSQAMIDFVSTNIVFSQDGTGDPPRRRASWRCNVEYLSQHYGEFRPDVVDWFRSYADDDSKTLQEPRPCTLPVLFVFGGKSPYNRPEDRELLPLFFPNSTQVEVPGAGHFVHYEKMAEFIEIVAPFIAKHLDG